MNFQLIKMHYWKYVRWKEITLTFDETMKFIIKIYNIEEKKQL